MKTILLDADANAAFLIVLLYIAVAAISLWIYYAIIRSATKANENILLQKAQVKLLASIAFKLGVTLEDINKDTKGIELNEVAKQHRP